jgi:DNA polymerase-3 subunit delta
MARHSYDDLLRALGRNTLAPAYYLFGPEDILKEEAARTIIDRALQPGERDFNLDQRSAQGLPPEDLHALVNTLPMMATRRVVVIREIEAWKKKSAPGEVLRQYLENPSQDTVLILVESAPAEDRQKGWAPDEAILGRTYGVDFEPLPPDRVVRWLDYHAKRLGITFAEGAAEHLATVVGYELGSLRAELEKLGSLADTEPLSRDQVGDIVGVRHGETVDDWVEAVLASDAARAVSLGRRVIEQSGMSGVKMVTAVGTTLIGVRLARAHYDGGSRGGALERTLLERLRQVRPFGLGDWKRATRNWARWAEQWPAARLRAAIRATLESDMALKGTRISDEGSLVTDLALRLAVPARESASAGPGVSQPAPMLAGASVQGE